MNSNKAKNYCLLLEREFEKSLVSNFERALHVLSIKWKEFQVQSFGDLVNN